MKFKGRPQISPKFQVSRGGKIIFNLESLINFVYPPICGICGELSEKFLCENCEKILEENKEIRIEKIQNNYYQEQIYVFKYQDFIRDLIIKYKFKECSYLYKTFSVFFLKNEKLFEIFKSYDKIIPVPISKKRMRERGYNQCELIAKEIAKNTGVNFENKALVKIKNNERQSELTKEERMLNVIGTYSLNKNIENTNKNILIFDDIITTGNTLKECSKILSKTNPKKIGIFTIAKD